MSGKYIKTSSGVFEFVEFNERHQPIILTDNWSGSVYNPEKTRTAIHESVQWEWLYEEEYNKEIK